MAVFYPTNMLGKAEKVGPYILDVSLNALIKTGIFPLIIISHGSGGSQWVYRTLAHYLAGHNFIVGLPEHPFNNRNNNTWQGTVHNLIARPRHIQVAINGFFDHRNFAFHLKPDKVALIGHSMGGYTALALAGGVPTSFPNESPSGQPQQITVAVDSRIKALVLLAPAAVWFMAEKSLSNVKVPILLLTAEKDEYTFYEHTQIILDGVPIKEKIEHRVIANAGHFSFLSPFPESMTSNTFPPSQDPPGFDRNHFQDKLNEEVFTFLAREI
ncbi:MAG: alpha/beta fold hydrolase [Ferruginibacter sp.]|nr:alpha/beta fold hydrolase [Cytophagales bacterium]